MQVALKISRPYLILLLIYIFSLLLYACDDSSGCGPIPYYTLNTKYRGLIQYKYGQQIKFLHADSSGKPKDTIALNLTDTGTHFADYDYQNRGDNCDNALFETKSFLFSPTAKNKLQTGIYAYGSSNAIFYVNFGNLQFESWANGISTMPDTVKTLTPNTLYSYNSNIRVKYSIAKGIISIQLVKPKETWTLIQ